MKKYISVLVAMGLVLALSSFAFAVGGIVGTVHDMSAAGGSAGLATGDSFEQANLDRVCIYCHAPHNTMTTAQAAGSQGITYYPLWNHAVSTVMSYLTYTNGAGPDITTQHGLQANLSGNVTGVSRLCLSCHDGSVATNAYGFNGASSSHTGPDATVVAPFVFGGAGHDDLSNHHPISFNFVDVINNGDDEIATPDTQFGGFNPNGLTIGDVLTNGNMECSTCHDVHNTKSQGEKFLWVSDAFSALCLSCHLK